MHRATQSNGPAARHAEQQQLLAVMESMLDGDVDDARFHVEKWANAYLATHSFSKDAQLLELGSLLNECYARLAYRSDCGGLPPDVEKRVVKAIRAWDLAAHAAPK